jgi:hypothetical protein
MPRTRDIATDKNRDGRCVMAVLPEHSGNRTDDEVRDPELRPSPPVPVARFQWRHADISIAGSVIDRLFSGLMMRS